MNSQETQVRIRKLLRHFVVWAEQAASVDDTYALRVAEAILLRLLREIGYENLRNLNDTQKNYPGIDLADDRERIAFQVTATRDIEKVKQTLRRFVKYHLYEKYDRVIIYVLTKRQSSYSATAFREIVGETFSFNPDSDIWDSQTLLQEVDKSPIDRARRVAAILESEFGEDPQPFPYLPNRQPDFVHPYPLQKNFVGRRRERKALTEWFTRGEQPLMAVVEIGGMGKSALSWVWLHQDVLGLSMKGFTDSFSIEDESCRVPTNARPFGVLWWSFYEPGASFSAFVDHALAYTSGGDESPHQRSPISEKKIADLLEQLRKRRFLLVLDGFERELRAYLGTWRKPRMLREILKRLLDILKVSALNLFQIAEVNKSEFRHCQDPRVGNFLRSFASPSMQSCILLTSRHLPQEIDDSAGVHHYVLRSLAPEDAAEFFYAQKIHGPPAEIQMACKRCGYHPLSLRLLAGVIAHDKRFPGDVRVARRVSVVPDLKGKQHHILDLAYRSLSENHRTLLGCIAAFRKPMPYDALSQFNTAGGVKEFHSALDELMSRGLLLQYQNRFDLHPVVRDYAYEHLGVLRRKDIHEVLSRYFASLAPRNEPEVGDELDIVIEQYHHTARSGQYENAYAIIHDKLFGLLHSLGDYPRNIEMLNELFPDGEGNPPNLSKGLAQGERRVTLSGSMYAPRPGRESPQAWAMKSLGISYRVIGSPRSAEKLLKSVTDLCEELGDTDGLIEGLVNLCDVQWTIGAFRSVDDNLRWQISLSKEIGSKSLEVVGHQDLGLRLAFRGQWIEAEEELETALELSRELDDSHREAIIYSHKTRKDLLLIRATDPSLTQGAKDRALTAARRALKLLGPGPSERNRVRASWLLGEAFRVNDDLTQAEGHLYEALIECRHINLLEFEADILLSYANLHLAKTKRHEAVEYGEAALRIAKSCDFVLEKADAYLFLARVAFQDGNPDLARTLAEEARESARCGGPPDYTYKVAYDEAVTLLRRWR